MIKAVIFDLFGIFYTDSIRQFMDEAAYDHPDKRTQLQEISRQNSIGNLTYEQFVQALSDVTGKTTAEISKRIITKDLVKDEAMLKLVTELRPHYKTCLMSNIMRGLIGKYFTQEELNKYFDVVVLSSEVGYLKPEPEIYVLACQKLGITPAEALFVDDSQANCDGATRVGMQAIYFEGLASLSADLADKLKGAKQDA